MAANQAYSETRNQYLVARVFHRYRNHIEITNKIDQLLEDHRPQSLYANNIQGVINFSTQTE